jgi:hypothetical protein
MNFKNFFDFFVINIFPIILIVMEIVGCIFGLLVLKKKKLKKIGPLHMYRCLFIVGIVNSPKVWQYYLHNFNIQFETSSVLACRLTSYYWYVTFPLSPMILVYISIERFFLIKYPDKRHILNKKINQYIYMLILVGFNLIINIWIPFDYDLVSIKNSTNLKCATQNKRGHFLIVLNSNIIPYTLIIIFTILLIYSLFKSRSRVVSNYTNRPNTTFKRDIKFAFTSISLNAIFFLCNLPITFTLYYPYPDLFLFFLYLHLLSFSINFYLLFIFNSLFRKQFLSFFIKTENSNNNTNIVAKFIRINSILILNPNVNETNL